MKYLSILFISIFLFSNNENETASIKNITKDLETTKALDSLSNDVKVTFIELGSVRCIPCQQMQKVIKSIDEKYGDQVETIFYDVWTEAGKPYAKTYNIKLIPTQIFLDKNGKEYFRHEGFFPEEELIKVLKKQGVK